VANNTRASAIAQPPQGGWAAGELVTEQLKAAAKLAANDQGEHGEPAELVRERLRKGGFSAE